MGKSSGKKGFVIADDGTIIRGDNKRGKKGWVILIVILISIITIGLTMFINSNEWDDTSSYYYEPDEWDDTSSYYYEPDEWGGTIIEEGVEEDVSEVDVEEYDPDSYVY